MAELTWIGKKAVEEHHLDVPFHLLREDERYSVGEPDTENLLIQGDNLLALKALLPRYGGKVKCIYIDPPYNTGNESWVYNDNVNSPEIRAWLGKTVGGETEDLSRHDKWLCMMYPRLVLLRELLAQDGSFWMSIDDNEVHNSKRLLNSIFGEGNFITQVVWQSRVSPANDAKYFSSDHEYLLVYAKHKDSWSPNRLERTLAQLGNYSNPDNDPRGPWNSVTYTCNKSIEERPNLYYGIRNPNNGKIIYPSKTAVWKYNEKTHKENEEHDLIYWGVDGSSKPRIKRFLKDMGGVVPRSIFFYSESGHTQEARSELLSIIPESPFTTPKPTRLIQRILQIATDPDDLVLDSFAGSGTTAHAVMQQNEEDNGNRRFILVEMENQVAKGITNKRLQKIIEGYSYKGIERTELLKEKLTVTAFKKSHKIVARMDAIKEEHKDKFDGFETKIENDHIIYSGKKRIKGKKEGLGGGFRYMRIGPPLLDETGLFTDLHDDVSTEELVHFIFFRETGEPLPTEEYDLPLLGIARGKAVYLLDETEGGVLNRKALALLPTFDGPKVVYGVHCTLSNDLLNQAHITFRQVPYGLQVV